MIATRKGVLDQKTKAKMAKEEKAIEEAAKEMERAERAADKAAAKASSKGASLKHIVDSSSQLWTSRYAPKQLKDICGNKQAVEKLQGWLHDWFVYSHRCFHTTQSWLGLRVWSQDSRSLERTG